MEIAQVMDLTYKYKYVFHRYNVSINNIKNI